MFVFQQWKWQPQKYPPLEEIIRGKKISKNVLNEFTLYIISHLFILFSLLLLFRNGFSHYLKTFETHICLPTVYVIKHHQSVS